MTHVIERTGSQLFQFSPGSAAMVTLFDSQVIERDSLFQELKKNYHVGIQCFIQDLSLTSNIKSLPEATIPAIRASDTYQQQQLAYQKAISGSPHFLLQLYIANNTSAWVPKGEIVLQNRKSPYYPSLLSPYFTVVGEVLPVGPAIDGSFLKIGAKIESAFGTLKTVDVVAVLTSYTLKYSLVPKKKAALPSLSLPFSTQVPVLRNGEQSIMVRPANANRSEIWLESHADLPVWFCLGTKDGLEPGVRGLALYDRGSSQWFQSSSLGSQQAVWALALPPENDDGQISSVLLTGIEIIQYG